MSVLVLKTSFLLIFSLKRENSNNHNRRLDACQEYDIVIVILHKKTASHKLNSNRESNNEIFKKTEKRKRRKAYIATNLQIHAHF